MKTYNISLSRYYTRNLKISGEFESLDAAYDHGDKMLSELLPPGDIGEFHDASDSDVWVCSADGSEASS